MTPVTPQLHQFLKDWLEWLDAGAPDLHPFARSSGLCLNAVRVGGIGVRDHLGTSLRHDFPEKFSMPFSVGWEAFWDECLNRRCHANPFRVNWARQKVAEYEESL